MDLDEFSDDGFDDLTDHALQELEQNAIQLTQAHGAKPSQPRLVSQDAQHHYSDYGWEEDDDLDTTEVTNDVGVPIGRPVIDNTLQQHHHHQHHHHHHHQAGSQAPRLSVPPVPNPRWNPAIDPANRPGPAMAARARLPSVGPANQPFPGSQRFQPQALMNPPQPSQFARPPLPPNRLAAAAAASQASQAQPGDIVSALQQRVRALEAELNAARGEASIIRANSTKTQQEYDAQIARLKKLSAEQMEKQERIVEAAVAAEKSANTELQFLQRDMREVSDRARRKEAAGGAGVGFATPKKAAKTWGLADGFDEMDMAASPSKGQGRGKSSGSVAANVGERTPSKGKRKRPVVDSPIAALEIDTEDVVMGGDEKPATQATQPWVVVAAPTAPFEVSFYSNGYVRKIPGLTCPLVSPTGPRPRRLPPAAADL